MTSCSPADNGSDGTVGPSIGPPQPPVFTVGPLQAGPPCCVPEPLIHIDELSLRYGGQPVFADVTLTINRGCITALIGPSGCGKTSFLTSLNRLTDLVPSCRVRGRVRIGPVDVHAAGTDVLALRRKVGMIFQKPNPFPLSIRNNLDLPLRDHGVRKRRDRRERIERVLRDVGLWAEVSDRLESPAVALSGGQQQRLCIARALVLEPEILLLDEPCSALDPLSADVVENLITGFRGRFTVVVVTHNLAQARRIADFAAFFWMKDGSGRLIEHGTAQQVLETPRHSLTEAYVSGRSG